MHTPVPRRSDLGPLRVLVGLCECPEKVSAHVASAVRHGVDLRVAGFDMASHYLFARLAFDGVENRSVDAGAPVVLRGERLDSRQLGHEVRCAGASYALPYPTDVLKYTGTIHPTASFTLPIADIPGQELDDVLARVVECFAYLVEDAGSLCLSGLGVCAAFFADIFES